MRTIYSLHTEKCGIYALHRRTRRWFAPPENFRFITDFCGIQSFAQAFLKACQTVEKSGESLVLQSESPPCEGGWRGVSLVGRVFRRLLLSACGGVLNPSVCCADSSPRRGAKLPATSPYRIHDRAEKIESSDTAPIRAAPACLQKSLFRQAVKPWGRLADSKS